MLAADPHIEVVDVARDGEEAVAKARELRPDVVTLDVNMPRMDGLTALQHIIAEAPCAVVMISSLTQEGAVTTIEALELGAVDFVAKPGGTVSLGIKRLEREIVSKVKAAARANLRSARPKPGPRPVSPPPTKAVLRSRFKVVVIGVSTGGPRTVMDILPYLPEDLPAVVLLVQHMPENFTASFAERLNRVCQLSVKEAEDGDELVSGRILVAKGGWHLKVARASGQRLVARLTKQPADALYFPSVDVTMRSVLDHVSARDVVGVLLTGMGSDGAESMVEIRRRGGYTIAEAQETAVVWGMPREAYVRGGAEVLAPSFEIAQHIVEGVYRS
jgi:two-component system chemotaxis response regulator CheB